MAGLENKLSTKTRETAAQRARQERLVFEGREHEAKLRLHCLLEAQRKEKIAELLRLAARLL